MLVERHFFSHKYKKNKIFGLDFYFFRHLIIKSFNMEEKMKSNLTIEGDRATLKILDVITMDNVIQLQEKLDEIKNSKVKYIDFDLSECKTISSIGIARILMYNRDSKTQVIRIVKCPQSIYELLTAIKLNQIISISL